MDFLEIFHQIGYRHAVKLVREDIRRPSGYRNVGAFLVFEDQPAQAQDAPPLRDAVAVVIDKDVFLAQVAAHHGIVLLVVILPPAPFAALAVFLIARIRRVLLVLCGFEVINRHLEAHLIDFG